MNEKTDDVLAASAQEEVLFTPEELERFVGRSVRNPRVRNFYKQLPKGQVLAFNITLKEGDRVESEVTVVAEDFLHLDEQVSTILGAIKLSGEIPVVLVMDGKVGMMLVGVGPKELGA